MLSLLLSAVAATGVSRNACREAAKDVVQRVGSRGTPGVMVAALCRRLTPSLLAPEHISELLALALKVCSCKVLSCKCESCVSKWHTRMHIEEPCRLSATFEEAP